MRENGNGQRQSRVRRSSGRAYADIMRGREADSYADEDNVREDDGDWDEDEDDAYSDEEDENSGYGEDPDDEDEPETEWDRRARVRKTGSAGGRRTLSGARQQGAGYARRVRQGGQADEYAENVRHVQARRDEPDDRERMTRARRGAVPEERPLKRRKKRQVWKWILLLVVLLAAFVAGKNLLQGKNWTIAVFGVDSRDGEMEKGTRSDVIMLVNVNKRTGEVKLASVYRDTYLKIGDGAYNKINAAYEKGGHQQAIRALEENLDVKIDDYMTFSWAAVAKGINALGGIDLEISDAEFSYINAFITETVNATGIGSTQLKKAGPNHLDGAQAVAYGRLRLMDTDFNRTARQRKVLGLAMDKAKQADFNTLKNAALAVLPDVSTSIGIDDIVPLLRKVDQYQIAETTGFPFSLKTEKLHGQDYVIPTTLESNVTELHQRFFGEEAYSVPASVRKISQKIGEDSGYTEPGQEAPDFGTGGGTTHKEPQSEAVQPEEQMPEETPGMTESVTESSPEAESESESTGTDIFEGLFPSGSEEETEEEETTEEPEAPEGGPLRPSETKEPERQTAEHTTEAPTRPQTAEQPQETEGPAAPTEGKDQEAVGPGANLPAADGAAEAGPGI